MAIANDSAGFAETYVTTISSLRPSDAYRRHQPKAIIKLDSDLSPVRRQAIIWTIADMFLIGPLGSNFSEIWTAIYTLYSRKCRLGNVGDFVVVSMCQY